MTTTPEIKIVTQEVYPSDQRFTPCQLGRHQWAWNADGGQACGHCGLRRS